MGWETLCNGRDLPPSLKFFAPFSSQQHCMKQNLVLTGSKVQQNSMMRKHTFLIFITIKLQLIINNSIKILKRLKMCERTDTLLENCLTQALIYVFTQRVPQSLSTSLSNMHWWTRSMNLSFTGLSTDLFVNDWFSFSPVPNPPSFSCLKCLEVTNTKKTFPISHILASISRQRENWHFGYY